MTSPCRIVVATAPYGGGHDEIAAALLDELRSRGPGTVRATDVDLLERCAPRSAQLARVAYNAGEAFFPSGSGSVTRLAGEDPEDPILRELLTGGMDSASAVLGALAPDLVVGVHPVAAGIAAEAASRVGCRVAAVVPDLGGGPVWVHPACDLYFVPTAETRDALVLAGADYTATIVSGMPVRSCTASPRDLRAAWGMEERFTVALVGSGRSDARAIAAELTRRGMQVITTADSAGSDRGTRRSARPVRVVAETTRLTDLAAAADVIVADPCGSAQWIAPALATPVILVEPVPALEYASAHVLVCAGAALPARDAEDAARVAAYLMRHPERVASMRADAGRLTRPGAARLIVERLLAHTV